MDFDQSFFTWKAAKLKKIKEAWYVALEYYIQYVTATTFLFQSILYYFPAPNKEIDFFLLKQLKIATYEL